MASRPSSPLPPSRLLPSGDQTTPFVKLPYMPSERSVPRAALCAVTASVLKLSLRLLGIEVLERL